MNTQVFDVIVIGAGLAGIRSTNCLLYTSDAADERG